MAKEYKYITKTFTFKGKRYYPRGKTLDEAIENKVKMLAELKAEYEKGKGAFLKDEDILFRDYAINKWAAPRLNGVASSTKKDHILRLKKYIIPFIGEYRLKDITSAEIISLFNNMKGMSKDRIAKTRQTLKRVFEAAHDDRYITVIPNIRLIDMPKCKEPGTRRAITPYERDLTLRVAEYHHAGSWVLTMLYTGLRPQETSALQGRHIDFKKMQITVEQARKNDGKIDTTKSKAGRRIIPIPPQLATYLPKVEPFEFVFKSKDGYWLSNSNQQRLWKSFKTELQIAAGCKTYRNKLIPPYPIADDLIPYLYRHTFCCDCVTAGVPIETLKELAGHASISVTAQFYLHMNDERMKQAADLLAAYHSAK